MGDAELSCAALQTLHHVAVPHKDELRVPSELVNKGNRLQQEIRSFLNDHSACTPKH